MTTELLSQGESIDDGCSDAIGPANSRAPNTRVHKTTDHKLEHLNRKAETRETKAYFDLDGGVHTVWLSTTRIEDIDHLKNQLMEVRQHSLTQRGS